MMNCRKTIWFPIEVLPALKGISGQKVTDTQNLTNTKIYRKRKVEKVAVHIVGQRWKDVKMAEKVLLLATKHFESSICPPFSVVASDPDMSAAELDIQTFFFELLYC